MSCHMLIEATTTVANKVNVVSEVLECMARSNACACIKLA